MARVPEAGRTLGVLVAGGRGRRLGLPVPKALATLGDRTFLDRALSALDGACDDVVVALPRDFELPLGTVRRVDDLPGAGGALAGLLAGLGAAPFDHAVALGVDYPLMTAEVLVALLEACARERARVPEVAALVPVIEGRLQPLAAVYAHAALAPMRRHALAGGHSLLGALESLPALARADEAALAHAAGPDAVAAFTHVNAPADLARAALLAGGSAA
jgi:molybdopterin-guanine dinucleotide biosynthesis protein A